MKILVIVTHPDLNKSVINKRWVAELEKYPEIYKEVTEELNYETEKAVKSFSKDER